MIGNSHYNCKITMMKPDMKKIAKIAAWAGHDAYINKDKTEVIYKGGYRYDPLTNDAQAFELLRKYIKEADDPYESVCKIIDLILGIKEPTLNEAIVNAVWRLIEEEG